LSSSRSTIPIVLTPRVNSDTIAGFNRTDQFNSLYVQPLSVFLTRRRRGPARTYRTDFLIGADEMKTTFVLAAIILGISGQALASGSPFTNAKDESDPRVVAFYETQCNKWADQNQLSDEARSAYLARCIKDMPSVYPAGPDNSSD
jgi:hypothetical protein